jgi:hypothetical protein
MKHVFTWPFIILLTTQIHAQTSEQLENFNRDRLRINDQGMVVLGSWAVANISWGTIAASQTSGRVRAFHQMNAGWNLVNLAIAGAGYFSTKKAATRLNLAQTFSEQKKMEKVLIFNAVLDLAYVTAGIWMMEYAKRPDVDSDNLTGFGQSLILQGGFLFAFDVIMVHMHARNWSRFQPITGNAMLSTGIHAPTFGFAINLN